METLADRIRRMTDDELGAFLFVHQVKALSGFIENGGAGCRNALEMKQWLQNPAPGDEELLQFGADDNETTS